MFVCSIDHFHFYLISQLNYLFIKNIFVSVIPFCGGATDALVFKLNMIYALDFVQARSFNPWIPWLYVTSIIPTFTAECYACFTLVGDEY